jgi:hypothetical protein
MKKLIALLLFISFIIAYSFVLSQPTRTGPIGPGPVGGGAGVAEVQDEAFSAANFNGDTAHAVSQDDFYDRFHLFDTNDNGSFADEAWLTNYMTPAEFTAQIGAAYDTSAELDALFLGKQNAHALLTSLSGLALTVGDMIYASGVTTFGVIESGTSGYLLRSNGAALPSWTGSLTGLTIGGFSTTAGTAAASDVLGYLTQTYAALLPDSNDGATLGSSTVMWSDLFLASGGVINWNNGDTTLTHDATGDLVVAGGNMAGGAKTYTIAAGVTGCTQLNDVATPFVLLAAEVSGTLIMNDVNTATVSYTLPTPAAGYNFILNMAYSGVTVSVTSGTTIYIDGTATAGATGGTITTCTVGEYFSCWTINDAAAGEFRWTCRKQDD